MTRNPKTVTRQTSIREAAVVMRDENCGVVPVVDVAGRLEGILTDRDIVVRGLIDETTLRRIEDVMTDDVSAVTEDEPLTSVLDLMGRKQIRRVPVVDRNDRLLGIISMADIANRADYDEDLQDAFERISSRRRPGACSAEAVGKFGRGPALEGSDLTLAACATSTAPGCNGARWRRPPGRA